MAVSMLYCADPLAPRRVDPHFASEARLARDGGARVALVDHDALLSGAVDRAVHRVPAGLGAVWYRGWMIPVDRYQELAAALTARGVDLLTTPGRYRTAHELPGWYDAVADLTAPSVWLPVAPGVVPSAAGLAELVAPLGGGPAIVKDYVKSRKHEWREACFVPDLADVGTLHRIVGRLVELQGAELAGGVVVRAFEHYGTAGGGSAEARVWWLDGGPVLCGAHPDTPGECPDPPLDPLCAAISRLAARFVTTDLACRDDGVWRVVEVGDGQVSDLPDGADTGRLIDALLDAATPPAASH